MVHHPKRRDGFTLVELLVVIGIIALLIGILLPVMHKVRQNGYIADSKNFISQLTAGIEQYHSDFRAYPGPLSNAQIYNATTPVTIANATAGTAGFDTSTPLALGKLTMSENLTLGLVGGLNLSTTGVVQYDASQVGLGPMNLNQANPKRYSAYVTATNLSWRTGANGKTGAFADDGGNAADDTLVPEFVDRFPETMPILYLRSKVGVDTIVSTATGYGSKYNSVITDDLANTATTNGNPTPRAGAYDLSQIFAYTSKPIGTGRTIKSSDYVGTSGTGAYPAHGLSTVGTSTSLSKTPPTGSTYVFPYDAFAYFQSPSSPGTARQKDGYILIGAGVDRVYGTSDDICSFGDVNP